MKRVYYKISQSDEEYFYWKFFTQNPNWNSSLPNEDENLRWTNIKKLLDQIELNNNYKILDLGSGRGWLTNLLSSYGNVEGIEPVSSVVIHARKLYPNINFKNGIIEDILKTNSKYNIVVSSEVLEHVPYNSQSNFVKNISKTIVNNGYLIITTPRKEAAIENRGSNQPIEDTLYDSEFIQLLQSNNFEILQQIQFSPEPHIGQEQIYRAILAIYPN